MFKKLSHDLTAEKDIQRRVELYRKLLRHEAAIGGKLFGEVGPGRHREFFCLDTNTWVWHEEWTDEQGTSRYVTTRYDMKPGGIVKSQNGNLKVVTKAEAANLVRAIRLYEQQVETELYAVTAAA